MERCDIDYLFDVLGRKYEGVGTELVYETPFQLLVSVVLSAQTTDKQVNKVTKKFFDKIRWPQDVVELWLDKFEKLVRSVNYYRNKAKYIYHSSEIIIRKYSSQSELWYSLPQDWHELQNLPGVGEKTAKVITHVLYGVSVIAVDTHVHRVANRLGLVKTKTPLQTSKLLETVVPDKYKNIAHHSLIHLGRYVCKARKPECSGCELLGVCKFGNYI